MATKPKQKPKAIEITVETIIDTRKRLWAKYKSLAKDAEFVQAVADKILEDAELREIITAFPHLLIECTFTIVNKSGETVPFFLNEVQKEFISRFVNRKRGKPFFILKGRQQGFTSLITAIQLAYTLTNKNFNGFTVAHRQSDTEAIFNQKAKVPYNRLPDNLKPHEQYNTAKELYFDKVNCSWQVVTATENIGRSRTLHFVHLSECAWYSCPISSIQSGLLQAATKDAIIIYETTVKGYNEAKTLWDSGSCENLFFEWWQSSEYRDSDITELESEQTLKDSWLVQRIKWLKSKGLDNEQIAWYCKTRHGFTDKDLIKQEYPCTAEEAFLTSGNCYFGADGKDRIIERLGAIKGWQPETGYFEYDYNGLKISNIRWVADRQGYIKIYKQPEYGKPYVLGGDTAGEGSDYFTGQVIDNSTSEQVAVFKKLLGEEIYARQMYCLGMHYNKALIAIEINFSTYPQKEIERLGYGNIYLREREDSAKGGVELKFGFKTTTTTRPAALAELAKVVREEVETINDRETLLEMLSFVKDERGKAIAEEGKHDDLVMALAIAHYARPQQSYKVKEQPRAIQKPQLERIGKGKWVVNY